MQTACRIPALEPFLFISEIRELCLYTEESRVGFTVHPLGYFQKGAVHGLSLAFRSWVYNLQRIFSVAIRLSISGSLLCVMFWKRTQPNWVRKKNNFPVK